MRLSISSALGSMSRNGNTRSRGVDDDVADNSPNHPTTVAMWHSFSRKSDWGHVLAALSTFAATGVQSLLIMLARTRTRNIL